MSTSNFENQSLTPSMGFGNGSIPVMVANSNSREPESSSQFNLLSVLHAFRRWWKLGLPLGILCATALSAAVWILLVPTFTASAYLRLAADDRPLIFETADQTNGRSDFQLYKNTQQQLMKTPFVVNAALRNLNVASIAEPQFHENSMLWLQENVRVSYPGDGEIMQVACSSKDGRSAVKIVNAVVDAFMDEVVGHERNEKLKRLESLERVHGEAEDKVRSKRSELKTMASALGTGDSESLTVVQQSALNQFGHMQEKLSAVQFQLMQIDGDYQVAKQLTEQMKTKQVEGAKSSLANGTNLSQSMERPVDIVRLEEEIEELVAKRSAMQFGPGHPTYKSLTEDLKLKRSRLERRKGEFKEMEQRKQDAQNQLASSGIIQDNTQAGHPIYDVIGLGVKMEVLKNQERILQKKVDDLATETRALGRSSIDIELMRSEIKGLEDVLQRVGGEIERTKIELKTSSRIQKLSAAENATSPGSMKRLTRVATVGFLGLFAPMLLLLAWDLSHSRVDNASSVSNKLSLAMLGTIPFVSRDPLLRDIVVKSRKTANERIELSEAVDSMASIVLHRADTEGRQIFMISSAVSSEGKSTVACQLSTSLARSGKKVVLLDFDLRRPCVHRYLALENDFGLSEVLQGKIDLNEALLDSDTPNLKVLTAGLSDRNVSLHCTNGSVDLLFKQLRDSFDIVVMDTSPILPVADSRILVKYCDSVIMTMIRDVSRLPLVAQAYTVLKSYGAVVMGCVVIGAKSGSYSNQYYSQPLLERSEVSSAPQS